jgi:Uma2 family endonuclease
MSTELERRLFTVGEYHRLLEAGILTEDDRVELIAGEIVMMSPIGARHVARVNALTDLFDGGAAGRWVRSVQNPVRLSDLSEPEPDLAILRWRDDYYEEELATASDVLLIVEVADSNVATDRRLKIPLYGRSGVPEVWLVDLTTEVVEVHTEPSSDGYARKITSRRGDKITASTVADLTVAVVDILGRGVASQ